MIAQSSDLAASRYVRILFPLKQDTFPKLATEVPWLQKVQSNTFPANLLNYLYHNGTPNVICNLSSILSIPNDSSKMSNTVVVDL